MRTEQNVQSIIHNIKTCQTTTNSSVIMNPHWAALTSVKLVEMTLQSVKSNSSPGTMGRTTSGHKLSQLSLWPHLSNPRWTATFDNSPATRQCATFFFFTCLHGRPVSRFYFSSASPSLYCNLLIDGKETNREAAGVIFTCSLSKCFQRALHSVSENEITLGLF